MKLDHKLLQTGLSITKALYPLEYSDVSPTPRSTKLEVSMQRIWSVEKCPEWLTPVQRHVAQTWNSEGIAVWRRGRKVFFLAVPDLKLEGRTFRKMRPDDSLRLYLAGLHKAATSGIRPALVDEHWEALYRKLLETRPV